MHIWPAIFLPCKAVIECVTVACLRAILLYIYIYSAYLGAYLIIYDIVAARRCMRKCTRITAERCHSEKTATVASYYGIQSSTTEYYIVLRGTILARSIILHYRVLLCTTWHYFPNLSLNPGSRIARFHTLSQIRWFSLGCSLQGANSY